MIDVVHEKLVPVRDVPRHLPSRPNGKKIHISACYRWISRGVKGVRLEAIRLGGTSYTSVEALQRFADRLATSATAPSTRRVQTITRKEQIDRAVRKLETSLSPNAAPPDTSASRVHKTSKGEDS